MKTIWLCFLLALPGLGGEPFRTDINPALLYHQAFLVAPDLSAEEREYLFVREWRGQPLDDRFGELVSKYDHTFKLFRQAAHAEVPCDWGVDLTDGPEVMLPGLARAKNAAQTARLRAMWHLQHGRQNDARDDLLAVFVLGRNVSRDQILISALVQFAIENIIISEVAANFHRFTPETLKPLVDGIDASPARGTIAECLPVERYAFKDWVVRKILSFQEQNAGDETRIMEEIREMFRTTVAGEEDRETDFADNLIKAAGGTSDGVVQLFRDLDPWFERAAPLLLLYCIESESQMKAFDADVDRSPNPLVPKLLKVFRHCRQRELAGLVRLSLLRAAVEYRLRGEEGLRSVEDPCGSGPLEFRRFVFEGVDRGFELKSAYAGRDYPEVLIFVEKEGPPFRLDGKNAGQPLPKEPAAK
jgi:hypothetical protein